MKTLTLAAAAALLMATVAPVMAQPTDTGNMQYPTPQPQGRLPTGYPNVGNSAPGRTGYQANTYTRRPSSRTPTDVGNMAFPDPSLTPAGSLPPVAVGR